MRPNIGQRPSYFHIHQHRGIGCRWSSYTVSYSFATIFFLLQNIKIQKKIETEAETEKKQLKGKINKLNDVASISKHSQSLKDERIQDLNNQLTKAKADTDLMFKVTLNAHHFNLVHNDCIKLLIPETMLYLV